MMHLQKNVSAALFLCLVILLRASPGSAEELYRQFSLGGGSLTTAPADAKAPEPGVITAKYGFKIAKDFMPYMGTGLAYTYQPDTKTGDITKFKTGVAAQFGFSYLLGTNSTFILDYKYLSVSPEQQRGDSRTLPHSLGIGLDIKF
jgi:opacity protein-like surface antigen